jgi:dTDP-4-dehydrorhamnose reductase
VKILLTGKNGQVGFELLHALAPLGEVAAFDRVSLDLAAPDQITSAVRSIRPDVIINAAAYTAVDRAESEPELANTINASGVGVLAQEAKRAGALLIHYSTDYVFDGTKNSPYVEDDRPNPLSAYGRSKLAGELAIRNTGGSHLILRTSWVFASRGRNFFLTIRRLLKEKSELRVVSDQIGAPTSAHAIAEATAELLRRHDLNALRSAGGTYHLTAVGHTSWHGFAAEIARLEPIVPAKLVRIVPIPSSDYPVAARRPNNSRLSNEKISRALGIEMPRWEQCLESCYAELALDRMVNR